MAKFIYSEKATKFAKSTPYFCLYVLTVDISKVEISQNFVAYFDLGGQTETIVWIFNLKIFD